MVDRTYNSNEINILQGYYGGTDDDWDDFMLKPDSDYLQGRSPFIIRPWGKWGQYIFSTLFVFAAERYGLAVKYAQGPAQ